jgi:predicted HicB family RNase H-like nuclease
MAKVKKHPGKTKEGYWITKGGTVVTPEVEERWTKECEEGFDLSTFTRVRVGRPPLDGERVSERITIRVPPDLFDAAQEKAAKERRSISNLTREALQRYVAE